MYTGHLHQPFFMLDLSFLCIAEGWWAAMLLAEEWVSPYKHSRQQSSPVWAGFHFQGLKCFSVSCAVLFLGLQELFIQRLTSPQDKRWVSKIPADAAALECFPLCCGLSFGWPVELSCKGCSSEAWTNVNWQNPSLLSSAFQWKVFKGSVVLCLRTEHLLWPYAFQQHWIWGFQKCLKRCLWIPRINKSLGTLCAWLDASPIAFKSNFKRWIFLLAPSSEQVGALHSIVDPTLVPCYIIPECFFKWREIC